MEGRYWKEGRAGTMPTERTRSGRREGVSEGEEGDRISSAARDMLAHLHGISIFFYKYSPFPLCPPHLLICLRFAAVDEDRTTISSITTLPHINSHSQ